MPQFDLSSLSNPELRALLDATRERGEAAQSYKILQEMAERRKDGRERGGGLFGTRRPPEPRVIAVDLGDPLDTEDDVPPLPPNWRPPAAFEPLPVGAASPPPPKQAAAPRAEPDVAPSPQRPRRGKTALPPKAPPDAPSAAPLKIAPPPPIPPVEAPPPPPIAAIHFRDFATDEGPVASGDADEEAIDDPQAWDLPPLQAEPPRHGDREGTRLGGGLRRGLAAVFAVGLAGGIGLGVWLGGRAHAPPEQPTLAAYRAALAQPQPPPAPPEAAPAPAAVRQAAPEAAPEVAPDAAQGAPQAGNEATNAAANEPGPAPQVSPGPAAGPPPEPAAEAAAAAPDANTPEARAPAARAQPGACAAEPTPADRTICGDPQLRRLQHELRQSYAHALAAHRDRALLRERQLAWASARDGVSNPHTLARLYAERIRKLNAATADARRQS